MAGICMFSGSYYDPQPWTHQVCAVEASVPEGCPIHVVTGAQIDTANVTAQRISGMTMTDTPASATIIGTDLRSFTVPDEFSCDCAPTGIAVDFDHLSIAVPAAVAGYTIRLWGISYQAGQYEVTITAPAACPTPDWPTDYQVALSCDRCPEDPDTGGGSGSGNDPDDLFGDGSEGGCSVGSEPSLVVLVAVMLPLTRRRRRR